MEKIIASESIIEIAGNEETSEKLNTWAEIVKWLSIVAAVVLFFAGLISILYSSKSSSSHHELYNYASSHDNSDYSTGIILILIAIIQGALSFFYVYIIRAFAIITEAASIIVLEHKNEEPEVKDNDD